jgi:Fur family ferric uptake transcriptional regulator
MSIKRKTKSVSLIISIFNKTDEALSVVDLVNRLMDSMNKTTVYRILDRMEKEGTIHSFTGTNGLKWYAKCYECRAGKHRDVHPHFECKACGKVECLDINIPIPKINNKQIDSADILITGQCADCME